MIFHPVKNNGRTVTIAGQSEEICQVLSNGKFRIKSEINGPIVHDFELKDIQAAQVLTVSFTDNDSYTDIVVAQSS